MSCNKRILISLLLLILSAQICSSQYLPFTSDTIPTDMRTAQVGIEKFLNSLIIRGMLNYSLNTDFGKLSMIEQYVGTENRFYQTDSLNNTIIKSSFRDDQLFSLNYELPIVGYFNIKLNQSWLYSSDAKAVDLNTVERLTGAGGINYVTENGTYLELLAGIEKNTQLGITSSGPSFSLAGKIEPFQADKILINSDLKAYYTSLENDRQNGYLSANILLFGDYDQDGSFGLGLRYINTGSSNFLPLYGETAKSFNIENRKKSHFTGDLNLNFNLFDLNSNVRLFISDRYENRNFNQYVQLFSLSGIDRIIHELQLIFSAQSEYRSNDFYSSIILNFDLRNEKFDLANKYSIPGRELNQLQSFESLKDLNTSQSRLILNTSFFLSKIDTINTGISLAVIRTDTPSDQNYDDNDQLFILGGIKYIRRMSEFLNLTINFETQQIHTVNLKSQLSAQNNWLRSIRFSPELIFNIGNFKMHPRFEVLANYWIYDFENIAPGINSQSSRQFSYRDSIYFRFDKMWYLTSNVIVSINKIGILYWQEFEETPQADKRENFLKILFNYQPLDNVRIAVGGRYFAFNRERYFSFDKIINDNKTYSMAPETLLQYSVSEKIDFSFHGFYEIQVLKNGTKNHFTNFSLNTQFRL